MKRIRILAPCVMMFALGCHQREKQPTTETPANAAAPSAPANVAASLPAYKLEVTLDGLIAFAKDAPAKPKKVWALLADADYPPTGYTKDDLPPCVWDELAGGSPAMEFPPHFAHIRVTEGAAYGMADPRKGMSIAGMDLRIWTGKTGLSGVDLDTLASAGELSTMPDKLGDGLLKRDFTAIPGVLSARVLIEGGTLKAQSINCGAAKEPAQYSFQQPKSEDCDGDGVLLGEEVIWEQKDVTAPVVIYSQQRDPIIVFPEQPGSPVKIEILNAVQDAIDDPKYQGCDMEHYQAFRWYYRLAKNAAADCSDHYFPCKVAGDLSGRKCPMKELVP